MVLHRPIPAIQALGRSQAVRQRVLVPPSQVRILAPQPVRFRCERLRAYQPTLPASLATSRVSLQGMNPSVFRSDGTAAAGVRAFFAQQVRGVMPSGVDCMRLLLVTSFSALFMALIGVAPGAA